MKYKFSSHALFGLAAGLTIWFLNELWLYLYPAKITTDNFEYGVSSALIGIGFGAITLVKSGFFADNLYKMKRGAFYGAIFGLIGGLIGFALIDRIDQQFMDLTQQPVLRHVLHIIKWLILALFIGIAVGVRDRSKTILSRCLVGSAAAGLASGIIITAVNTFSSVYFISRGIGFLIFGVFLTLALEYVSIIGRKAWIRGLNGRFEGYDLELLQEIHYLGTQSNDDISLKSYQDIRPSHAKLVRYFSGYSLVDNDPFWQTYVNFRNIKEQPLKNGDVLKIGKALFQYCTTN
ncbi:MAG: FHA domain-containing protein [SAR324 cluster bacterium]|nr:FHA domain-containing protein [SAR324 cluster bacterium]